MEKIPSLKTPSPWDRPYRCLRSQKNNPTQVFGWLDGEKVSNPTISTGKLRWPGNFPNFLRGYFLYQVIQFVTFSSPIVGNNHLKGSLFHHPKKVTSRIARVSSFRWWEFSPTCHVFSFRGELQILGLFFAWESIATRWFKVRFVARETPYRNEFGSPEPFHPQKVDSSSYFLHAPCECLVPQIFNKKGTKRWSNFVGSFQLHLRPFFRESIMKKNMFETNYLASLLVTFLGWLSVSKVKWPLTSYCNQKVPNWITCYIQNRGWLSWYTLENEPWNPRQSRWIQGIYINPFHFQGESTSRSFFQGKNHPQVHLDTKPTEKTLGFGPAVARYPPWIINRNDGSKRW